MNSNHIERVKVFVSSVRLYGNIMKNIENILKKCIFSYRRMVNYYYIFIININNIGLTNDKKFEAVFDREFNEFDSFYLIA